MGNGKKTFANYDNNVITGYIQRFGNAASIGLLHPLCNFFTDSSIDGVIGYRIERNCAIAIGDPVCAVSDRIALAGAFNDFCKKLSKKVIYAVASESFTQETLDCFGGSALQFGHEIIIDPTIDTRTLTGSYPHHLRQKYKHALLHGVTISEYQGNNPEVEQVFVTIAAEWLSNRTGPQAFLLPLDVFGHRSTKRWFYAQKDNHIIGLVMLSRIDACHGWILNGSIMLTAQAPNSTSEFLILHVLEVLRKEGSKCLSVGPTMACEIDRMEGFGPISQKVINYGMKSLRKILKMNDRQRYWKKFQPRREPSFLMFTSSRVGWRELWALLRAFNVNV